MFGFSATGANVSDLLCSEDASGALAAEPPSDAINFSISALEISLSAHTAIRPPTGKVSPSFAKILRSVPAKGASNTLTILWFQFHKFHRPY